MSRPRHCSWRYGPYRGDDRSRRDLLDQQLQALPTIADPLSSMGYAGCGIVAGFMASCCRCDRDKLACAGSASAKQLLSALARPWLLDPFWFPLFVKGGNAFPGFFRFAGLHVIL
jgi:hypothetical protein